MKTKLLIVSLLFAWFSSSFCTTQHTCEPDIPSRSLPKSGVKRQLSTKCASGHYADGHRCIPCDDGTFMTSLMAEKRTYPRCLKCLEPQQNEVTVEPCTTIKDTKIMCQDGFYRDRPANSPCNSHCQSCDFCGFSKNMHKPYKARECQGFENSICCQEKEMVVKNGKCVNETVFSTVAATTSKAALQTKSGIGMKSIIAWSAQIGDKNRAETRFRKNYVLIYLPIIHLCIKLIFRV